MSGDKYTIPLPAAHPSFSCPRLYGFGLLHQPPLSPHSLLPHLTLVGPLRDLHIKEGYYHDMDDKYIIP